MLLKKIRKNYQTGSYEAREAGYLYQFDEAALERLNLFLKDRHHLLIADWYRSLTDSEKLSVIRKSEY